jgi:outer membrane protein assembly factor BamB
MVHHRRYAAFLCIAILALLTACRGHGAMSALPAVQRARHALTNASISQWTSGQQFAPSTIAVSFPSVPATGDTLVVALWNNGISGGNANTYAAPAGWTLVAQDGIDYESYELFSHVVAAGESNAYVFTPASAQRQHVWIGADVGNAGPVDSAKDAIVSGTTTWTTPALTPSQSGDLALVFELPYSNALKWTNPAGWNAGTGPTSEWSGEGIFQQLASGSAVSETSTLSAASSGFSALVLIAPSGAPAPPTPTPTPTASPTTPPTTPPGGAPALSQSANGSIFAPPSIAVSFPAVPAPGHVLVVALWNNGQSGGAANTYTPPAGWTLVDQNSGNYSTYQSFSHVTGAGESNSYVFTPAAAQRQHVWLAADVGNAAGVDIARNQFYSGTSTFLTPSVTPSTPADLALAIQMPYANRMKWTNAAGWSVGTGPTAEWSGETVYEQLSSLTPVSETSTLSTSSNGYSAMILLLPGNATPTPPPPPPSYSDWNTFGDNLQRTGYNPNETTLSATNVNTASLHQLWSTNLGGPITAQPILATNVSIAGSPANVLYVGTENNVFYAVNADTGAVIWKNNTFGAPVSSGCNDLPNGQFGITGTATYDRNAGLVYVADGNDFVHALSMTSGAQQWSVNALTDPNTGTVVGAPSQDHIYGAVTFNPNAINPDQTLGTIYVYTGSVCETPPWNGRIVAIEPSTQTVTAAFFPGRTTSGKSGTAYCGGGIWGMGGASIDAATNDVYVASGNIVTSGGGCLANAGGETFPYGDAVIQLDDQLNLLSSATANVNGTPVSNDSDYGATPMLYSVSNCASLQVSAKNKNGYIYTYGAGAGSLTPEQQLHVGNTTSNGEFIGVPAYDPGSGLFYVGNPNANGNFAHGLNALQTSGCSGLSLAWKAGIGSANITSDDNQAPTVANGVVYFTDGLDNKTWAFNAASGAVLWNSNTLIGSPCTTYGTTCGVLGAPMVDGHLFVGAWNGNLYAFGF